VASDLARKLAAHHHFPQHSEPDHVTDGLGGYPEGRLSSGLLLRHQPVGIGSEWWWLPDLTDAATAGVLLSWVDALLVTVHHRREPESWRIVWHGPCNAYGTLWAPTLGEAAASAMLSLWSGVSDG